VSKDRDIEFGTLNPDGTVAKSRVLSSSQILTCPHILLVPDHYREDGTCKCNEESDPHMREWGYSWDGEAWV
jgi:hypothetical protein